MTRFILTLLILTALPISLPAQTICVYEIDSTFWPAGTCRPGPGLACWISPIDEWIVDTNAHWFLLPDWLKPRVDTVYDTVYAKSPCEHDKALDKHIWTLIEHLHDFQKFWITPCEHWSFGALGIGVRHNIGDTVWSEPSICDPLVADSSNRWGDHIPMPPDGEKCRICGETRMRKE